MKPMPSSMLKLTPFGKAVRKHRIDAGLLQRELAERIGRSPAFLSNIETGEKRVPTGVVDDIAAALKLNESQRERLCHAAAQSQQVFEIRLAEDASPKERATAAMLTRFFGKLSDDELDILQHILLAHEKGERPITRDSP